MAITNVIEAVDKEIEYQEKLKEQLTNEIDELQNKLEMREASLTDCINAISILKETKNVLYK